MFAVLKKFGNQDFYDSHREFYIMTPEGNRRYEIIAAFQTDALSNIYDRNFSSTEKRQAWFQKVLRSSVILRLHSDRQRCLQVARRQFAAGMRLYCFVFVHSIPPACYLLCRQKNWFCNSWAA